MRRMLLGMFGIFLLSGCGSDLLPQGETFREDQVVVRARGMIPIGIVDRKPANQTQGVTVSLAAATSMTLDTTGFSVPTISNAVIDFGKLKVATLIDNELKVCGAAGNQKCLKAFFRIFSSGVAGDGVWNTTDGYGAPLKASLAAPLSFLTFGLGVPKAAVMQTINIGPAKQVVRLADFSPAPDYRIQADFTDAGTGSFSTTIVIEYALSL